MARDKITSNLPAVWEQIVAALAGAGVELLPPGASFGAVVRLTAPRERRPAVAR